MAPVPGTVRSCNPGGRRRRDPRSGPLADHPLTPPGRAVRSRRSAHDTALNGIGLGIIRREFEVGSLLPPKEALMQRFGVSQTTLREALQTLSAKGLIVARAKVGTRVQEESRWNMFDADILAWRLEVGMDLAFLARLFEIRQALEPMAAGLAALRRGQDDLDRLKALLAQMRREAGNMPGFVEADAGFHHAVLVASGNPFMQSVGSLIATSLEASLARTAPGDDRILAELALEQHGAIVAAIEEGNAQRAADTMMVVIEQGWKSAEAQDGRAAAPLRTRRFLPPGILV